MTTDAAHIKIRLVGSGQATIYWGEDALNALFEARPIRLPGTKAVIVCGINPGFDFANATIAENNGWSVI